MSDAFDPGIFGDYSEDKTQLGATAYPFVQWRNGNNQASFFARTGGLFVSSEQVPPGCVAAGELIELTTSSEPITGHGYPHFKCLRLAARLDWEPCLDAASGRYGRAVRSYEAAMKECVPGRKPRGRTRFVLILTDVYASIYDNRGNMTGGDWQPFLVDEASKQPVYVPFMLTVKSTNGIALNQVFKDHITIYVRPAEKAWGVMLPDYGLKVPVKVGPLGKPNPSAQGTTTPPMLMRPTGDPVELAKQLVPSKAILDLCKAEWPAAQEWAKADLIGEFGEPEVPASDERGGSHGAAPFQQGVNTNDDDF